MANVIGAIQPFQHGKGTWISWIQRARLYMTANEIAEDRQVPVLLTLLGEDTCETLANLVAPDEPATRTIQQIEDITGTFSATSLGNHRKSCLLSEETVAK